MGYGCCLGSQWVKHDNFVLVDHFQELIWRGYRALVEKSHHEVPKQSILCSMQCRLRRLSLPYHSLKVQNAYSHSCWGLLCDSRVWDEVVDNHLLTTVLVSFQLFHELGSFEVFYQGHSVACQTIHISIGWRNPV